ncbi:LysR family transcriptional regulator [Luteibacter yeojuensis]|uniref:Transcriptional regulator n=1 Tax=Luteibacter yeojuensis TaxID=345309 RepID=A0A0F3KYU9_9GAMM|nr:LysR family transcriptional regulator [Luteibacter yeojuensis]KJV36107.1 transcriptional regulator [Luteibacter yeojuensis]
MAKTVLPPAQQSGDGAALAELMAFVAVAEELSFTRAGQRMGRDATVLSRRVAALEARLGVKLLRRTTRAVSLTDAGRTYLGRARAILGAMAHADREAAGLASGEPHGHLRVALPGSFGRRWVWPLISRFLAAHPHVTVEATFENRFVDMVAERFDAAVRLGDVTDARLVARKVAPRPRVLCASPAYLAAHGEPATAASLVDHACLVFPGTPGPRWELRDGKGRVHRVDVRGPVRSDDVEALVAAACDGHGILLTSEWAAADALADGRLRRVLDGWRTPDAGAIYVVTPSARDETAAARAFVEYLVAGLATQPWK